MRRTLRTIASLALLALPASAQDLAWPDNALSLVERLDHAEWDVRERAELELAEFDSIPYVLIEQELLSPGISPERAARLERVASSAYRREPLGGLGVQFGGPVSRGVAIQRVIDNGRFPAAGVLQDGDIFTHVSGLPLLRAGDNALDGQERLRAEILSRSPGDLMPVTVLRNGEPVDLDVPLGSFGDLDGARVPGAQVMLPAVRLRLARLRGERAGGVRIDQDAWRQAVFGGADPVAIVEALRADQGMPTLAVQTPLAIGGRWIDAIARARHGGWSVQAAVAAGLSDERGERYARLANERERLQRRANTYEAMLAGPGLDDRDRQRLLDSVASLRVRIDEIEGEIDALLTEED